MILILRRCFYIPPYSNLEIYEQHGHCIKYFSKFYKLGDYIIVLSNFNPPNIKWFKYTDSNHQNKWYTKLLIPEANYHPPFFRLEKKNVLI